MKNQNVFMSRKKQYGTLPTQEMKRGKVVRARWALLPSGQWGLVRVPK